MTQYICRECLDYGRAYSNRKTPCILSVTDADGEVPTCCPYTSDDCAKWERVKE